MPSPWSKDKSWQKAISAQGKLVGEQQQWLVELNTKSAYHQFPKLFHHIKLQVCLSVSHPNKSLGKTYQCKVFFFFFPCSVPCMPKTASLITRRLEFLNRLTSKALGQATAVWEKASEPLASYDRFTEMFLATPPKRNKSKRAAAGHQTREKTCSRL